MWKGRKMSLWRKKHASINISCHKKWHRRSSKVCLEQNRGPSKYFRHRMCSASIPKTFHYTKIVPQKNSLRHSLGAKDNISWLGYGDTAQVISKRDKPPYRLCCVNKCVISAHQLACRVISGVPKIRLKANMPCCNIFTSDLSTCDFSSACELLCDSRSSA